MYYIYIVNESITILIIVYNLYVGVFAYIHKCIKSLLNLYYILYNYFQRKEIFGTVMAFYLYPSLFSLLIIILTYKATQSFMLCSILPDCLSCYTKNNSNIKKIKKIKVVIVILNCL